MLEKSKTVLQDKTIGLSVGRAVYFRGGVLPVQINL